MQNQFRIGDVGPFPPHRQEFFCEVCGALMGTMTRLAWERAGKVCDECASVEATTAAYGEPTYHR